MTTTYTIKLLPTQCDLDSTFSSGQTFRWHKIGPSWFGIIGNRSVLLTQLTDQIQAQTPQTCKDWSWLEDYLQLKLNHESMIKTIRRDAFISEAIALYPGLRLLRQDPWECLASFILSSANSIPQIQRAIDLLCQRFGNPIPGIVREIPAHSFPKPEILAKAKLSDLTNCKIGFRAKYLKQIAFIISKGIVDLNSLHNIPTKEARRILTSLPGVGPKIADCVLLFAYGRFEVFPVDTWIRRAMQYFYFRNQRTPDSVIRKFATEYFGRYAGYAQQFIYHHTRTSLRIQLSLALAPPTKHKRFSAKPQAKHSPTLRL